MLSGFFLTIRNGTKKVQYNQPVTKQPTLSVCVVYFIMPLGIVSKNYNYWIRQRPSVHWQPGRSPGTILGKVGIIGGALQVTGHVP